jgi:hypothetical protein
VNLEERLRDALEQADAYPVSGDLLARVTGTLAEDALHRVRVRRTVSAVVGGGLALTVWFAATGSFEAGGVVVPGWSLEVAVTLVLVALLVTLGPLLRRFGRPYLSAAIGPGAPPFAPLLDIAYYLVGTGYILLTATVLPDVVGTPVDPSQLTRASSRIGGMALLLGGLHTGTLAILPLVGLLLRSMRWRGSQPETPNPRARTADRVATVSLALFGALLALAVAAAGVLVLLVGLGD